jgi:hypothetical protein
MPELVLAEYIGREDIYARPLHRPGVIRQSGFYAGLAEKGLPVPLPINGYLRKEQAS